MKEAQWFEEQNTDNWRARSLPRSSSRKASKLTESFLLDIKKKRAGYSSYISFEEQLRLNVH
jgi:hypothetical protein